MGNSEVGHLNLGAGRIVHMDVTRIDGMIASGDFYRDPTLLASMQHAKSRRLHLMGLLSDGGVHSMNTHMYALLKMAKREGVSDVCIHAFTDGRDTGPNTGAGYLEQLQQQLTEIGVGRIATVIGRYYAMDRDQRWDRIERAQAALVDGVGEASSDAVTSLRKSYEHGVTDEFAEPIVLRNAHIQPVGSIREGDACIFFNYRADRGRELSKVLTESPALKLHFTTLTRYDKTLKANVVLPPEHPNHILANVMAEINWRNLRVAETEKYAHVTYFFNGGKEKAFPGEEREMIASPKVATYDLKPEMSAQGITDVVTQAIDKRGFDIIIMNFANADMVGHSGKMAPTVKAVEAVDACLGEIHQALRRKGGRWIITADHGNAEMMIDPTTGGPHTYHTTNPVPFIVVDEARKPLRQGGALQDVAPTMLSLLGMPQPKDMTGRDLHAL